jgi:hypothetical protein
VPSDGREPIAKRIKAGLGRVLVSVVDGDVDVGNLVVNGWYQVDSGDF